MLKAQEAWKKSILVTLFSGDTNDTGREQKAFGTITQNRPMRENKMKLIKETSGAFAHVSAKTCRLHMYNWAQWKLILPKRMNILLCSLEYLNCVRILFPGSMGKGRKIWIFMIVLPTKSKLKNSLKKPSGLAWFGISTYGSKKWPIYHGDFQRAFKNISTFITNYIKSCS